MYFAEKMLLGSPVSRAAYSDRTAWLMAEMSRLAYFRFECGDALETLADELMKMDNKARFIKQLQELLSAVGETRAATRSDLGTCLGEAQFKVVDVFNEKGTQAFLAVRQKDKMAVLAFRGTEMDIADIRTDLETTAIDIDGNRIHEGFYKAFKLVESQILNKLDELEKGYTLYITGHSLGGALALLATKYLCADSLGACYTFGGPRVASARFSESIKTPIYRVINAADIVPRMPPAFLPRFLASAAVFIPIPVLRSLLIKLFRNMIGYRHHGDMRQLTACLPDCSDLQLLTNPNMFDRGKRLIGRWIATRGKAAAGDHSIDVYCNKLGHYAKQRSQVDKK